MSKEQTIKGDDGIERTREDWKIFVDEKWQVLSQGGKEGITHREKIDLGSVCDTSIVC